MSKYFSFFIFLFIFTAIQTGCSRTVIAIKPGYDFQKIKRVALLGFEDYPDAPHSGGIVSSLFEKSLIRANYQVLERRQIKEILKEHQLELSGAVNPKTAKEIGKLLNVDALIFGNITTYTPEKKNLVFVDIKEVTREPIIQKRIEKVKRNGKKVAIEKEVIAGYTTVRKIYKVPQSYTMEAEAGLAVRMVDVETGELLWVGSAFQEALNIQVALEILSNRIMKAVRKTWPVQNEI